MGESIYEGRIAKMGAGRQGMGDGKESGGNSLGRNLTYGGFWEMGEIPPRKIGKIVSNHCVILETDGVTDGRGTKSDNKNSPSETEGELKIAPGLQRALKICSD